jgi:hypothetical protein
MRARLGARRWADFDMHHLLWEPAVGPRRFFELYCETWRRSVLNLSGRKSLWEWLRQVGVFFFRLKAEATRVRLLNPWLPLDASATALPPARCRRLICSRRELVGSPSA